MGENTIIFQGLVVLGGGTQTHHVPQEAKAGGTGCFFLSEKPSCTLAQVLLTGKKDGSLRKHIEGSWWETPGEKEA